MLRRLIEAHAADSAARIATAFAARAGADVTFQWFARADARRDAGLAHVKWAIEFRGLHTDPRRDALAGEMGFED